MESWKEYLAFLVIGIGFGVTIAGIYALHYQSKVDKQVDQRNNRIEHYLRESSADLFRLASTEFSNSSLVTGAKLVGAARMQLAAVQAVNNSGVYRSLYNISGNCYWNGGTSFENRSRFNATVEKCSQITGYLHRKLD